MTALAWLLLAAAVVVAPSAPTRAGAGRAARTSRGAVPPAVLPIVAAVSVAGATVALFGPVRGGLTAAAAAPIVAWSVRRLAARAPAGAPDADLPLTLDLAAAALRGGQPVPDALRLAAPRDGPGDTGVLGQVASLLRLGAEPGEAWRLAAEDPALAALAQLARRSSTSGIRLASGLEGLATELRAELRTAAEARAHRAGVLVMAPLGLCFLPAFVCLGVIPVVVGIAREVGAP